MLIICLLFFVLTCGASVCCTIWSGSSVVTNSFFTVCGSLATICPRVVDLLLFIPCILFLWL